MISLDSGDKVQGDASAATVVDFTIYGLDNNAIKQLADGQLAAATGDLYTADSADVVTTIILVNTDSSARTVNLFLLPSGGTARRIIPKDCTLGVGYSLHFSGDKVSIIDAAGAVVTSFGTYIGGIQFFIDGSGSAITTGIKGAEPIPFACTINSVTLVGDQSGSIVIDIWKQAYADYPPENANSITASAPPTITTAAMSTDSTLTGWTTAIAAGDVLMFNVDSITSFTWVMLSLKVTKT